MHLPVSDGWGTRLSGKSFLVFWNVWVVLSAAVRAGANPGCMRF